LQALAHPPSRQVHTADALAWLQEQPVQNGCAFITSLPDASEFPKLSLDGWKQWFVNAAGLVLGRCPDDSVAIFFQTDVKTDGHWVDKGFLCQKAAEHAGFHPLWHKVVCRAPPGAITFGRPSYSHLLCFSRGVKLDLAKSTPDVLPEPGENLWTRGMPIEACKAACRYVLSNTSSRTIVDPFCGLGTVLAVANALGLSAVGVEISPKRARKARALRLELQGKPQNFGA